MTEVHGLEHSQYRFVWGDGGVKIVTPPAAKRKSRLERLRQPIEVNPRGINCPDESITEVWAGIDKKSDMRIAVMIMNIDDEKRAFRYVGEATIYRNGGMSLKNILPAKREYIENPFALNYFPGIMVDESLTYNAYMGWKGKMEKGKIVFKRKQSMKIDGKHCGVWEELPIQSDGSFKMVRTPRP